MIAIIDNGEEYSDHSIYFVDVGDKDPRRIAEELARDLGTLDALVETVEWFAQTPPKLVEFLNDRWDEPSSLLVSLAGLQLCEGSGERKPRPDKDAFRSTECASCGATTSWLRAGLEMERKSHWLEATI